MIVPLQMLAVAIVIAALWGLVRNRFRLWRIAHRGGHLLVAGDDNLGPIVAGEARAGNPAIVMTNDARPAWRRHLHRVGSPHLRLDSPGGIGAYLKKARMALIVGPYDDANIATAEAMLVDHAMLAGRAIALPMIVRIDDTRRHDAVERGLSARIGSDEVHVRLISLPALIGRALLRTNLLDRIERIGSSRRFVVAIGFTPIIECYVADLVLGAHFGDGRDPLIVILDPAAVAAKRRFEARWSFADRATWLDVATGDLSVPADIAATIMRLAAAHGPPAAILIDAADTAGSIAVMEVIDTAMRQENTVSPAFAVHAPSAALSTSPVPASPFGGADIADYAELLLYERQEAVARAVHDFHLEGRLDDGEALGSRPDVNGWDALPETIRDDYRLLIDLYILKLRDLGARIVTGHRSSLTFEPDELADLIHADHRRRTATIASPETADPEPGNEEPSQSDAERIAIISRLLARSGQHAVRDLRVLVEPGYPGDIEAAIGNLKKAYPDRTIVFLGDMADAVVRGALWQAHTLGHPVQIAMTHNLGALLAAMSHHDGTICRSLVAHADHIVVPPPGDDGTSILAARAQHRLAPVTTTQRRTRHTALAVV